MYREKQGGNMFNRQTYGIRKMVDIVSVRDGLERNAVALGEVGQPTYLVQEFFLREVGLVAARRVILASIQPHLVVSGHQGLDAAL